MSYKSGLKCSLLIHIVQVFITCSTSMIFYIHVKVHVVNTFMLRIYSKKKIACNLQRDFIKSKLNYHVKCWSCLRWTLVRQQFLWLLGSPGARWLYTLSWRLCKFLVPCGTRNTWSVHRCCSPLTRGDTAELGCLRVKKLMNMYVILTILDISNIRQPNWLLLVLC